jgi:hypothetical protein
MARAMFPLGQNWKYQGRSVGRIYQAQCDVVHVPELRVTLQIVHLWPIADMSLSKCPLSGVKRALLFAAQMSANDPKRTSKKQPAALPSNRLRSPHMLVAPLAHVSAAPSHIMQRFVRCIAPVGMSFDLAQRPAPRQIGRAQSDAVTTSTPRRQHNGRIRGYRPEISA